MILNNILIDLITLRTSPCAEGLNGLVLFGYHFERFHAFAVFRHDYIVHAFGSIYRCASLTVSVQISPAIAWCFLVVT